MSYFAQKINDDRVIELLLGGGVGFMPSDTIYGLSCLASDKAAVERIYKLKERDKHKPVIVLIANKSHVESLKIKVEEIAVAENHWPGPLTLVCSSPEAPLWLHRGINSLAIRLPGEIELLKLIQRVGPIVSTSANIQSEVPANSVVDAHQYFGDSLDFYVDVGELGDKLPSTIIRIDGDQLTVLREGAIKANILHDSFKNTINN